MYKYRLLVAYVLTIILYTLVVIRADDALLLLSLVTLLSLFMFRMIYNNRVISLVGVTCGWFASLTLLHVLGVVMILTYPLTYKPSVILMLAYTKLNILTIMLPLIIVAILNVISKGEHHISFNLLRIKLTFKSKIILALTCIAGLTFFSLKHTIIELSIVYTLGVLLYLLYVTRWKGFNRVEYLGFLSWITLGFAFFLGLEFKGKE